MDSSRLASEIAASLGFSPTADQAAAIATFSDFMFRCSATSAMLLCGSAGTGKTSLASAIVRTLRHLGQQVVLMAPTGRAAKVFAQNSQHPAHTIHRRIYRQQSFAGIDDAFSLNFNKAKDTLFIVDEASMVADQAFESIFGSGSLLADLIHFVYSGRNCHLMLIGDTAQLPPIGADESPALLPFVLEDYGLEVSESHLNEVLRQSRDSGILANATDIRRLITHDELTQLPRIRFAGFADIHRVDGSELIEQLASSYHRAGVDQTMVICRSNRRCNIYNQGIRARILDRDGELSAGDRVMIVRNNYHWTEAAQDDTKTDNTAPQFLANGDIAVVRRVRNERTIYGLRFADVQLQLPDYYDYELQPTAVLDSLHSEAPALTREQQEQLFHGVWEDYADVTQKAAHLKSVREDALYNALQIKYAYAITCHKAQGGQWEHIYLDQGYMTDEMLTPDYIHWLYTAFTRATEHLFLVNWPETQVEE